ncbi:MAG: site-specific integrase [Acidobacteria bacterium]|nr:site-specific integrase [Acidobacteriota bacterium]
MKLYKQPKGKTWSMRFVFEGRRIERSTGYTNKMKAEAYAEAFRTRLRNEGVGFLEKKDYPTFRQAMADFLEWSASRQKANTTVRYKTASKALIAHFGNVRLNLIGKTQIEMFVTRRSSQFGTAGGARPKTGKRKRLKRQISSATVNRELACLKKMFSNLVADGVLSANPARFVEFLKEENESGRVLDRQEERLYLSCASQPLRDYAILLIETGVRPNELTRLGVRDVHLDIERPYLVITDGKTKAARRSIPLSTRAAEVLTDRLANAKGKYVFAGGRRGDDPDSPAIKFSNAHYGALKRSKIDGANRTGTEGSCTLYSFRHTFATRFLESRPGDLLTLAALLGHSSLRMVMRYAHPSDNHKFEAIRSMEERPANATAGHRADHGSLAEEEKESRNRSTFTSSTECTSA